MREQSFSIKSPCNESTKPKVISCSPSNLHTTIPSLYCRYRSGTSCSNMKIHGQMPWTQPPPTTKGHHPSLGRLLVMVVDSVVAFSLFTTQENSMRPPLEYHRTSIYTIGSRAPVSFGFWNLEEMCGFWRGDLSRAPPYEGKETTFMHDLSKE